MVTVMAETDWRNCLKSDRHSADVPTMTIYALHLSAFSLLRAGLSPAAIVRLLSALGAPEWEAAYATRWARLLIVELS